MHIKFCLLTCGLVFLTVVVEELKVMSMIIVSVSISVKETEEAYDYHFIFRCAGGRIQLYYFH